MKEFRNTAFEFLCKNGQRTKCRAGMDRNALFQFESKIVTHPKFMRVKTALS